MSWLKKLLMEVYLWMYFKAYLQTKCLLTSWENQKKSAKTSEKICRPPQVWFILGSNFQRLKVPRSSVQTIECKYKHHGTTQPSYRSGRGHILSPRDERTLVQKVQINPRTTSKDLVNILEEMGTKISFFLIFSTVKRVLYRHNLSKEEATAPKPP